MTIKDHGENPRSDGWRGIRVTVTVEGKLVQRYFKRGQHRQAAACEKALLAKQRASAPDLPRRHTCPYNYTASRYDPPKRTGIVGLTIALSEQTRLAPVRYYPVINIFCRDDDGVNHATTRTISRKRGLIDTWRESCQLLARLRGYKRVPRGWYGLCPSPEDFEALRQWYCANGRYIGDENLQVLTGQSAA